MQTEDNPLFRFTGYSPQFHRQHSPVVSFSAKDARRSNKPIMEKRRRARINHCLAELKTLILDAMKKDPARHSKLEKADILEMTVKHLQTVQRQQMAIAVATDPTVMTKFRSGFNDCATEVVRYVSRMDGVDPGVSQRLMGHIRNCLTSLNHLSPPFNFVSSAQPPPHLHPAWFYTPASPTSAHTRFAFDARSTNVPEVTETKFRKFETPIKVEGGKMEGGKMNDEDDSAAEIIFDAQKDKRGANTGSHVHTNGSSSTPKPSTSTDADKMWRPW